MSQIDPDFIVEVLMDAVELGDKGSAEKHNIHRNTVVNYRRKVQSDPTLNRMYLNAWVAKKQHWAAHLGQAKDEALQHLLNLVRSSDDITKVTSAYKVISESFLSESVITGIADNQTKDEQNVGRNNQGPEAERARKALRESAERNGVIRLPSAAPTTKQ